jgi:AcrR family transcriptional regulator
MKQTKDEKIKTQIREAARGLFQKWGLHKTTMEDIAKAANKGKSTLYYYYKSKDEIFNELACDEFRAILQKARHAMEQDQTAEEKLCTYLRCTVEEAQKRATLYSIIFTELPDLGGIMGTLRNAFDQEELLVIRGILEHGIRSGEISLYNEKELTQISYLMMMAFKTFIFELVVHNKFEDAVELINFGATIFIRGMRI